MTDKHYAFVDRKCERCNGKGFILLDYNNGYWTCLKCQGTGMIGSYEEVPEIDINRIESIPYIAGLLRHTREQRNVGMDELAEEFGWSIVHLSNIEMGREKVTRAEYFQIMKWIEQR